MAHDKHTSIDAEKVEKIKEENKSKSFKDLLKQFVEDKTLSKEEAQVLVDEYNKNRWQVIKITQAELKETVKDIQVSIWAKVDIEKVWVWEDTITKLEAYIKDDLKWDITNVWPDSTGEKLSGIEGGVKQLKDFSLKKINNSNLGKEVGSKEELDKIVKTLLVQWLVTKEQINEINEENYTYLGNKAYEIIKVLEKKKVEIWKINKNQAQEVKELKEGILNIDMEREIKSINSYISNMEKGNSELEKYKLSPENKNIWDLIDINSFSIKKWDDKATFTFKLDPKPVGDKYSNEIKEVTLDIALLSTEGVKDQVKLLISKEYKKEIDASVKGYIEVKKWLEIKKAIDNLWKIKEKYDKYLKNNPIDTSTIFSIGKDTSEFKEIKKEFDDLIRELSKDGWILKNSVAKTSVYSINYIANIIEDLKKIK